MSQENVETLRRGYEALNRGDLDATLEICDPDIECRLPEGGLATGTLHGHKGLRELFEAYLEAFEELRAEPDRYLEADDHVVVFLKLSGRGRGSGLEVDVRPAHLWTMRDGKAVRLEVFPRGEGALEAAGLRE
jgi:uncharacterized protein